MLLTNVAFCALGLVLLAKASDHFVVGAARLAVIARVSTVVVGAVVVGFGTSAPEMLVSGLAARRGDLDLGVGNIIGSNVANLTLVLGVGALVVPLVITSGTLRRETPLALGAMVLFAVFLQDGIARWEGVTMLVVVIGALTWLVSVSRKAADDPLSGEVTEMISEHAELSAWVEVARTVAGLVLTLAGAQLLVEGALGIAEDLGLSDGFVGFTLVAVGTSLPELVTVLAAARSGETDLIIGNLLGSNLFNSLAVGAVIGLSGPGPLESGSLASIGVATMLVSASVAVFFMYTEGRVVRWEGLVLLVLWAVTIPLVLDDEDDPPEPAAAAVPAPAEAIAGRPPGD
ncbi:MAG: calcium/sodium antiporter [Actinomycetota bacterium]|nr:calcium/sodium antiporter [Actinomycetota bacterium]